MDDMSPPRRSRRIYVRARTDPQFAQLWWPGLGAARLAGLGAARHRSMPPPLRRRHNNVEVTFVLTFSLNKRWKIFKSIKNVKNVFTLNTACCRVQRLRVESRLTTDRSLLIASYSLLSNKNLCKAILPTLGHCQKMSGWTSTTMTSGHSNGGE